MSLAVAGLSAVDILFDVRGQGPSAAVVPMLVMLGFALVIGLIATSVFRWEGE